jgi:hypothetical protein
MTPYRHDIPRPLAATVTADSARRWSSVVVWLLAAVWVFNAADLLFTADALRAGRAEELNPFMDALFSWGLVPAALYKIGVVTAGIVALWLLRSHKVVLFAAASLAVALGAVVVYHVIGLWLYGL